MAGATLPQLREATRRRMGVANGDTLIDEVALDEAVNFAVFTLDNERPWPWLEGHEDVIVPIGASSWPTPADYRSTRSVVNITTGFEYQPAAPVDTFLKIGTGTPQFYAVYESQVMLDIDTAVQLNLKHLYYKRSPFLVNEADVTLAPADAAPAIAAAACAWLTGGREDNPKGGEVHEAAYNRWVVRLFDGLRPTTKPITPRIRAGSWM